MAQEKNLVLISTLLLLITPSALADQLDCLDVNIECPVEHTAPNNKTVTSTNCFLKILRRAAFERSGECIEVLILKNNHIEEIESRTFERLLDLKELDLSSNDMAKVSPETFVGLHNVTSLNLSSNHLDGIQKDTFANLTRLIHLDLSRNNIKDIDGGGFAGLKKLRSLDLSHNKMETLNFKRNKNKISSRLTNNYLSAFTSIESIDLSHNRIAFMGAISPTLSIKALNLSHNELKAWRYDSFVSIEILDCSHNRISELYFGYNPGPTKLRELDLSHNSIRDVTYTDIESTGIRTLRLANNLVGCYQERQYHDHFSKTGVSFIGSSNCSNIPDRVEEESIATFDEDGASFNKNTFNAYVDSKSEATRKSGSWKMVLVILLCATVTIRAESMGNLCEEEKMKLWLALLLAPTAALALLQAMSCGYGPRGSLTAICINATAPFFRLTSYRFDNLDETLVCVNCTLHSLESSTFDISGNLIRTLDIRNSSINAIHSRAFLGMIHMEMLLLSHNSIDEISTGAFEGIRKVRYLEMEDALTGWHLRADVFRELRLLEVLNLKNNRLTRVLSGTFEGLHNLRLLDLSNNNLLSLESDVFKPLVNLRILVLNDNSIRALSGNEFGHLRHLTTVNLARNELSNCSFGLGLGNSLRTLNLAKNSLSSDSFRPGTFENLTNLEGLDLSKNSFYNLTPKLFRGLYKLTELNLDGNMLQGIDTGSFSGLPHLRILNVSRNNLNSLEITGKLRMDNLVQMDLSHNNITSFDYLSLVARAPRLRSVNLLNNSLSCRMEDQLRTLFSQDQVMVLVSHDEEDQDCPNGPNVTTESGQELLYELQKQYQDPYISSTLLVWMFVLITVAMLLLGVLFYVQFFILLGMGGQSNGNVRLLRNFASTEVSDV